MRPIWLPCAMAVAMQFSARAEAPVQLFRVEPAAPASAPLRAFSGAATALSLGVQADGDTRFDVLADLFQAGSALAVPIFKDKLIAKDAAPARGHILPLAIAIDLPAVKAPALFILALKSKAPGSDKTAALGGKILIEAYPPEQALDAETVKLAEAFGERKIRLAAFGGENPFRALLEKAGADFKDLGADIPDEWDGETLYLGSADPAAAAEIFSGRRGRLPDRLFIVLFLHDAPSLPPGVYPVAGGGIRTKIHLPDLKNLRDPRARKTMNDLLAEWLKATQ